MLDNGTIESWLGTWGYLVVFVPLMLETAGIPFPGATILLVAAAASSRGLLDPVAVAVVASLGAIIGDNIGFCIGRYGGRRLVDRLSHITHVEAGLVWGERFFALHGGKAVVIARWTAGLRIFGAWIAGMSGMRWRTFLVWNTVGGITWACTLTAVGYTFGESLERVEQVLGVGGAIAFGLIVVVAGVLGLRWFQRRQRAAADRLLDATTTPAADD